MPVDYERNFKTSVDTQFEFASARERGLPKIVWAGMKDCDRTLTLQVGKLLEPADLIFPEQRACPRYHFFEVCQDALELGKLCGKLGEIFRTAKHFICIATNAKPSEIADPIHHLSGMGAICGQIAAMKNYIRGTQTQVCENRFEGGEVAVDVRHYRGPHAHTPHSVSIESQQIDYARITSVHYQTRVEHHAHRDCLTKTRVR